LLDAALALGPGERAAFIERACGADVDLRRELARMVAACDRSDGESILAQPAAERFASLWDERLDGDVLQAALAGEFALEEEVGRGGLAIVYRARDLRDQHVVALKVLRTTVSVQGMARFRREIALAAGLSHPGILPVLRSGEHAGRLWYTMPLADGESLGARLRRDARVALTEGVGLLRDVAAALEHAHARGVVHRDLKPDNILLIGGRAVIADLGVAKALAAAHDGSSEGDISTATGVSVGTPAYMAPEQATGEGVVDHRADLYSLGVIAYQLLAGVLPFVGESRQALLLAQLTRRPVPVSAHRPEVPPGLERLVMTLLARNAADRPDSAREVLSILATGPAGDGSET
jgi:serine/threonine-protein kinase